MTPLGDLWNPRCRSHRPGCRLLLHSTGFSALSLAMVSQSGVQSRPPVLCALAALDQPLVGQQHRYLSVLQHERQPLLRIAGSSGTYAPPALRIPSSPITISSERSMQMPHGLLAPLPASVGGAPTDSPAYSAPDRSGACPHRPRRSRPGSARPGPQTADGCTGPAGNLPGWHSTPQELLPFGFCQQRQVRKALLWTGHDALQHGPQMPQHPGNGGGVKATAIIDDLQ